jgi:hypothetical protein
MRSRLLARRTPSGGNCAPRRAWPRLLANTNRREEGRKVLADIYGWFTEGFDTADLKEAKALLDELNA